MTQSYRKHKDLWEAARLIAFTTAQVQAKQKLNLTDICKFPWETEGKKGPSKEEIERLRAMSRAILQSGIINQ